MAITVKTFPSVSIVVPSWNGLRLLKKTLDQIIIARDEYPGECEIIIVDNGSMDRTVDVLTDYYPNVIIEKFKKNMGFGHACNHGAAIAKGELVFFLNNDVFVPKNIVYDLVKAFCSLDNAFSICPVTYLWKDDILTDTVFSSSIRFSYSDTGELIQHWLVENGENLVTGLEPTVYATGAIFLVDKKKFQELGGFDSIYGLAYWEDVDICLKAWAHGWGSFCASDISAWHQVSATAGKDDVSDFKKQHVMLNYILLQFIHTKSSRLLLNFTLELFSFFWTLLKNKKVDTALFYLGEIVSKKDQIKNQRRRLKKLDQSYDKRTCDSLFTAPDKGWHSKPIVSEYIKAST